MKWKLLSLILVAGSILALISLRGPSSAKALLPDGSVFVLSDVKIGESNVFWCGPILSRMFRAWIPPKGIALAGFKLNPPVKLVASGPPGSPVLSVLFHVVGKRTSRDCEYRLLVHGESDVRFAFDWQYFMTRSVAGEIRCFFTHSFPRDAPLLHFQLEAKDAPNQGEWRELATFVARNPRVAPVTTWNIDGASEVHLAKGLDLELGQLFVRKEPTHWYPAGPESQRWDYQGWLPVRLVSDGHPETNWSMCGGKG